MRPTTPFCTWAGIEEIMKICNMYKYNTVNFLLYHLQQHKPVVVSIFFMEKKKKTQVVWKNSEGSGSTRGKGSRKGQMSMKKSGKQLKLTHNINNKKKTP